MSFSNICLFCLQHIDDLFEIFGKRGIELNTGATLKEHFWFEVSESDENSICEKCWLTVQNFHDFYNYVKSNHQLINSSAFEAKMAFVNADEHNEIGVELPNIDIDDCSPGIFDASHSHEVSELCMESMEAELRPRTQSPTVKKQKRLRKTLLPPTPTKYKTDSHTALLSTYFNMKCDLCGARLLSYRDTNNHFRTVHNIKEGYLICCHRKFFRLPHMLQHCQWHVNPDSFKCEHCPPDNEKVFSCNECHKIFSKQYLHIAHRVQHKSQSSATGKLVRCARKVFHEEHEMIKKRFQMQCDLCGRPFNTFRDAQFHHVKAHNQQGYLYCCDRKFLKMYRILQHCIWHDDPKSFNCSLCQICFTDKISLRDHIKRVHSPKDERDFEYAKDQNKQFECYICGIRCAILPLLKSHINIVHGKNSHICEICAKPFRNKHAYKIHYITCHSNISEKMQCNKCGKWLKNKITLEKHLEYHNSKTETCIICGRVSSNIDALKKHVRLVHREASLECAICGKMFKKQKVLKEHMAIHAGITDLYKCTFCTKTFRSNANMYSHRKRVHPVELEQQKESQKSFTPATAV